MARLSLQVVLELCRTQQVSDPETVEMHLERIKALVSSWAAQVGFSKCELQVRVVLLL